MSQQAPPSVAPSGEDAIHREITAEPEALTDDALDLAQAYEVDLTLAEIEKGGYQRIALQFADEQLHDAVQVYRALRAGLPADKELYVLADTTYGSCCVDEVAAQHVDADFVVHYGHTCLSPTARLPVLYILTKRAIDVDEAASSLASTSRASLEEQPAKAAVLLYDVAYAHKAHLLADALRSHLPSSLPLVLSHLDSRANLRSHAQPPSGALHSSALASSPSKGKERASGDAEPEATGFDLDPAVPAPPTTVPRAAARYDLPEGVGSVDDCVLFWIGGESLALNNVLLTHGRCRVWSYDPATRQSRLESGRTNRMLMRRYATVEKAKDADVIGILVGTLGVAAYLPLITHLRQLIASHHKKSYTVAVGKLNPAKLANFIEVECFVLVACPENSMVDSKEFLRPIVTPFELELALTSKAWTGDYILDFASLLHSSTFGQDAGTAGSEAEDGAGESDDGEKPVFSAATGTYRHPKRYNPKGVKDADDLAAQASALAIRDQSSAVSRVLGSAAGEYLASRSYKGLDPRYGQDAPAVLEMGREGGIARGYGYEKPEGAEEGR
ncbi:2-(3-amino-3-carboxypropyl)histidine synthase [Rhodotorula paludigena]|uniref:2-(3-amino-3-carboxypropyl)histidine synthase n=1 Tax=Rhodotorula paludigena TaxID=86838 RepID=UPI0031766E35